MGWYSIISPITGDDKNGDFMKSIEWNEWYQLHGRLFGLFVEPDEVKEMRDAAPISLRSAPLNADAVAVGQYMRRWLDCFRYHDGGPGGDEPWMEAVPSVPGDSPNRDDPLIEYSKISGYLMDC